MTSPLPFDHVEVSGTAAITVIPTKATVSVTLKETSLDVSQAKSAVDERSLRLIQLAQGLGISSSDIQSGQISIQPEYEWRRDNSSQQKGTVVSRHVTLVLRELSSLGDLLDRLVDIPITELTKLELQTSDHERYKGDALTAAIREAKLMADIASQALGRTVASVYQISALDDSSERGVNMIREITSSEVEDPFTVGNIIIQKTVSCVFRLNQPD